MSSERDTIAARRVRASGRVPFAPPAGRVRKGPRAVSNIGLTEQEQEEIRQRIKLLEIEHGDLDDVIAKLALDPAQDQLQLRRLKKRKLLLKDAITRLRDKLIPDIIA